MNVGDKVTKPINYATLHGEQKRKATGTVVSVHPRSNGGFYRVRFDFGVKSFVEAFPMKGGSLYDD